MQRPWALQPLDVSHLGGSSRCRRCHRWCATGRRPGRRRRLAPGTGRSGRPRRTAGRWPRRGPSAALHQRLTAAGSRQLGVRRSAVEAGHVVRTVALEQRCDVHVRRGIEPDPAEAEQLLASRHEELPVLVGWPRPQLDRDAHCVELVAHHLGQLLLVGRIVEVEPDRRHLAGRRRPDLRGHVPGPDRVRNVLRRRWRHDRAHPPAPRW